MTGDLTGFKLDNPVKTIAYCIKLERNKIRSTEKQKTKKQKTKKRKQKQNKGKKKRKQEKEKKNIIEERETTSSTKFKSE